MTKLPDIEELIKSNPKIDREQLEAGLDLIRRIREGGSPGAGYRLVPPGTGRRTHAGEEANSDPRTVRLGTKR